MAKTKKTEDLAKGERFRWPGHLPVYVVARKTRADLVYFAEKLAVDVEDKKAGRDPGPECIMPFSSLHEEVETVDPSEK